MEFGERLHVLFSNMCVCVAGDGLPEVSKQDLQTADLPPDPSLQVDQTERAQEESTGLVSLSVCPSVVAWH